MTEIILTAEQARLVAGSVVPVQVRDPQGNLLGHIEPALTPEVIAALKQRARSPGPWYTTAQVQARLQALEQEWNRSGGFDETHLREFLRGLNERDPGHMRPETGAR